MAESVTGVRVPVVQGVLASGYDLARFHRIALHVEPWPATWELRSDLAGSIRAVLIGELTRKGIEVVSADDLPSESALAGTLDHPVDPRPYPVQFATRVRADAVLIVAITDLSVIHHEPGSPNETLDLQVGIVARLIDPVTSTTVWSASYAGNHWLGSLGREQDVLIPIATGVANAFPSQAP